MPAYFRVHFDGGYSTNAEVWSTSFATTAPEDAPPQEVLNDWAQAVFDYFASAASVLTNLKGLISTTGQMRRVRIYYHADVNAPASLAAEGTGTAVTGSGTAAHPPQVGLVVSLLTGIPGRSYRGRMYWPAVGASMNSSFQASGVNQSMADNVADALDAMVDLAGEAIGVVTPQVAVVSATAGLVTPVTAVSIGNILDTQRRRRDALVETRFTSALT